MRRAVLLFPLAGCTRADPDPPKPPPPSGGPTIDVNGHVITPRTMLAGTHGGEAVDLEISSVAGRTCAEMFGTTGVNLGADEVYLSLTLGRPLVPDATWQVLHSFWPGGSGGADPHGVVEAPVDLAAHGGKLRVRYAEKFEVGAASPRSTIALDAELTVVGCGDHPPLDFPTPQGPPIHLAGRALSVRTVLVVPMAHGEHVILSTGARTCPKHSSYSGGGDFEVDFVVEGDRSTRLATSGELVPVQLNLTPAAYRVVHATDTLQIDSGDDPRLSPIEIHGRYTAKRCDADD